MRNYKSKVGIKEPVDLVKTLTNRAKVGAAQGSGQGIERTVLSCLKQGAWARTQRKEWAWVPLPLPWIMRGSTGIKSKETRSMNLRQRPKDGLGDH